MNSIANTSILSLIARITQLIGIPAVLFFCGWLIHSIDSMSTAVTRIDTQLQERTTDRYTATDAKHDFTTIDVRIDDLSRRVGVLESNGRPK